MSKQYNNSVYIYEKEFSNNSIIFGEKNCLNILSVKYGANNKYINVTNKVKKLFFKNSQLLISKKINLKNIFGDPCPGFEKEIKINALVNNNHIYICQKEKFGYLVNKIIICDKNILNVLDEEYNIYDIYKFCYNKPYENKNLKDISNFSFNTYKDYCEYSFINEYEIHQNLPRSQHNSKEKININVLKNFILIIDFHNLGGGTSVFIESIISKYKKYQTFLIARNFNNHVYFTVNDEYELENSYNNQDAYKLLLFLRSKIEKIFVNHTINHSAEFINNLFNLNINITTITHDMTCIFNEFKICFNDMNNYLNNETKRSCFDINKYDQIITQNKGNMYIYNNYIKDKSKIVVSPLPDFKNSKDLIKTTNDTIVIAIIGMISDIKGVEELNKIINFYKNINNIKIVVFGCVSICVEYFTNKYTYGSINELNNLLLIHRPNIIIELSICPETYSYTLSLAMITQLPILYLKKNNYCTIEERLSNYDKAYSFNNIIELDKLIYNKKQDYFYTIEPKIYFNNFWDNYFLKNKIHNQTKIIDNYTNKNLVLITSKIIVSKSPFTYSTKRSIYTKEQRFIQTINTIKSVRKHIPNSYIVLIDNSLFNNIEYENLFLLTDYFINITNNVKLNYYTNEYPIKLFAELMQQLCFYEEFIKKIDINKIRNFFKISGRYFINNKFDYNNFDNDYIIFKKNLQVLDRDYYYTSFYKINSNKILDYFEILKNIENEKEKYSSTNNVFDFEVVLPNKINDKKLINCLGITQLISVWNQIDDI